MSAPSLSHITRLLNRKYGRVKAEKMLAEALRVARLSGRDIRDVLVEISDGALLREESVRAKIRKQIAKASKRSNRKGYKMKNGVRVYQGGAPGLRQQRRC